MRSGEVWNALFESNQYIRRPVVWSMPKRYYTVHLDRKRLKESLKTIKEYGSKSKGGYLTQIKPQQLADFIINEHPQTIALILAHMEPTSAVRHYLILQMS